MLKPISTICFSLTILLATHIAEARGGGGHGHSSPSKTSTKASSGSGSSSVEHVSGYTKRNGTYVAPADRTKANSTKTDNWSAKPNVNPETGKSGTIDPYKQ